MGRSKEKECGDNRGGRGGHPPKFGRVLVEERYDATKGEIELVREKGRRIRNPRYLEYIYTLDPDNTKRLRVDGRKVEKVKKKLEKHLLSAVNSLEKASRIVEEWECGFFIVDAGKEFDKKDDSVYNVLLAVHEALDRVETSIGVLDMDPSFIEFFDEYENYKSPGWPPEKK